MGDGRVTNQASEREVLMRAVQRLESVTERLAAIAACLPGKDAMKAECSELRIVANHVGGVADRMSDPGC